MAQITFTKDQQAAIDVRNGNILVSAAAGSGKTAVLSRRVIELLTGKNPVSADRLIIVTFTVLASVEMRQRIETLLAERVEMEPENEWLQTQQALFANARICTIHSLCNELVRDHFQLLGLPADYRLADENELKNLKADILDAVLEQYYESNDSRFLALADRLSARDDRKLGEMVSGIYEYIRSYPFPLSYLDRFFDLYRCREPFLETSWGREIKCYVLAELDSAQRMMDWVLQQVHADEKIEKAYAAAVMQDVDTIRLVQRTLEENDWDRACSVIRSYERMRLSPVRNYSDPEHLEGIKSRRKEATDLLMSLKDRYLIATQEEWLCDMQELSESCEVLFDVVRSYYQAMEEEKLSRSLLDFSDLEQKTLSLLLTYDGTFYQKTLTAKALSDQFYEIMIDECQDINTVQNLIFWALSKGPDQIRAASDDMLTESENLFLVGDVKQSIYRFRNAMPALFTRRKKLFPLFDGGLLQNGKPVQIRLQNNFRSRREVADSVNRIFSRIMTEEVGEILYDESEQLVASASYPDGNGFETELHLLSTGVKGSELWEEIEDKSLSEADYVASLIEGMIQKGFMVFDHGQMRACRYRDFCILLRAKKGKTERFVERLKERGIHCYADASHGYFDSFEISVMLDLLRVLDNPLLDIPLFSVMLSPMFLFTPDEMVEIRLKSRGSSLYTALCLAAEEGNEKCRTFLFQLEDLRLQAVLLPVSRLIQLIYDQTGFLYVVESMASGEQKRANLHLLLSYAESYEQIGYRGLDGFIRFVDRAIERGDDFQCANTVSEKADVVRIMSIHGSKGLEFPICIVADLAKSFNLMDLRQNYLIHDTAGFGMTIRHPDTFQEYTNLPLEAIRLCSRREILSEEMRTLYVAMTRAKEKLILVGSASDAKSLIRKTVTAVAFDGKITSHRILSGNSYLSWIAAALSDSSDFADAMQNDTECTTAEGIRVIFSNAQALETGEVKQLEFVSHSDPDMLEQLNQMISYRYPYEELLEVPAKVTATQLAKSKQEEQLVELEDISLRQSDLFSGAARGTVLHSFMQYADFCRAKDGLEEEIARLVENGFLTEQEANVLNRGKIKAFFASSLFGRMMKAKHLYREYPFLYEFSADEIGKLSQNTEHETVMLQGIADAVLEEEDGIVIVDYKTDRITDPDELISKYTGQLEIYKKALEEYFDLPVKECFIYSLYLERALQVC